MEGCSGSNVAAPKTVNVPGIGEVLEHFEINHHSYDVDAMQFGVHHNESLVLTDCNTNWFARFTSEPAPTDDTYITCDATPNSINCSIRVDSEAFPLFWGGDVTTRLVYDASTLKWTAGATKVEEKQESPYLFCAPSMAFDMLIADCGCYLESGEAEEGLVSQSLKLIVGSWKAQKEAIASGLPLYNQGDCEKRDPNKDMPTSSNAPSDLP